MKMHKYVTPAKIVYWWDKPYHPKPKPKQVCHLCGTTKDLIKTETLDEVIEYYCPTCIEK